MSLATRFAVLLGQWTLLACAILLVAWMATLAFRRQAAVRHLIWVAGFAALLLVPIGTSLIPSRVIIQAPAAVTPARTTQEAAPLSAAELAALESIDLSNVAEPEPVPEAPVKPTPIPIWPLLIGLWLAGTTVVAVRALVASCGIASIKRRSVAWIGDLIDPSELALRLGIRRPWELRQSPTPKPPTAMTWGFVRPIVLLPKDSDSWSNDRLEATMLHELAHVRRGDSLTQRLAVAACALHWFNPAVWLAARALRADAEAAADDAVLRSGLRPSIYAAELLRIAAELGQLRQPQLSPGVSLMNNSRIEARIKAIVDPSRRRRGVTSLQTLVVASLGLTSLGVLCTLCPAVASASPIVQSGDAQAQELAVRAAQIRVDGTKSDDMRAKLIAERAMQDKAHTRTTVRRGSASEKNTAELKAQIAALQAQLHAYASRMKAMEMAMEQRRRAQAVMMEQQVRASQDMQRIKEKRLAELSVARERLSNVAAERAEVAERRSADSRAVREKLAAEIAQVDKERFERGDIGRDEVLERTKKRMDEAAAFESQDRRVVSEKLAAELAASREAIANAKFDDRRPVQEQKLLMEQELARRSLARQEEALVRAKVSADVQHQMTQEIAQRRLAQEEVRMVEQKVRAQMNLARQDRRQERNREVEVRQLRAELEVQRKKIEAERAAVRRKRDQMLEKARKEAAAKKAKNGGK